MKKKLLMASIMAAAFVKNAAALDVNFADESWDGSKVPAGQQCQKFGGNNPSTPKLRVSDIPTGSNAIVLEYSDRDSKKMSNGGHGRMRFALESPSDTVEMPSVPGHTFDISDGYEIIEAHRGPGWDKAGAYMPPCSGGKGHAYYVAVKAVEGDKVIAETVLGLGRY